MSPGEQGLASLKHVAQGASVPPFRDQPGATMLGSLQCWVGDFLFREASRPKVVIGEFPELHAKGKNRVLLSHQVLFLDTHAQQGASFPCLAWATGSPQRSPGPEGREWFSEVDQPNIPLLRVMFCSCKLHTILGHVVYYGMGTNAELSSQCSACTSHVSPRQNPISNVLGPLYQLGQLKLQSVSSRSHNRER